MPKALVTGVAGFIGSHIADRLLERGFTVVGVDSFTDYYPRWMKERNIELARQNPRFAIVEDSLANDNLYISAEFEQCLSGLNYVFHVAAQAGVRSSWRKTFHAYIDSNIKATQKLLEFCKGSAIERFIYASSSSVYGDVTSLPVVESALPSPYSPYGVSKLAGEHLCNLYWRNFQVPVVSLRYFTVYGPRQRPDMAFHKFIRQMLLGQPIVVFGTGAQTRDFTHVTDVVEANMLAMQAAPGEVFNIGGGDRVTLLEVIHELEAAIGANARLERVAAQKGDVPDTWADISKAQRALGYSPKANRRHGLRAQVEWIKELYSK
jgi:UDP-glucose 4-epimerase